MTPCTAQCTAFWTLPALMQPVQAFTRFGVPFTIARILWRLGLQRDFVRRGERVTAMPNDRFLPQISHTDAMGTPSLRTGCDRPRRADHDSRVSIVATRARSQPRLRSPLMSTVP